MKKTKSKLSGLQITPQQHATPEGVPSIALFDAKIESEVLGIHNSRQADVRKYLASLLAQESE